MKVQCFVFPWISVIYSFWPLPASQQSVETHGAVISWGCLLQGLGGSDGERARCREGGSQTPAMPRAHAERTGGHVWGHAALPSSGNSFRVLLCILHSGPAMNWKCQTKACRKTCSPSCTLGRPALRVSAKLCPKHLQKIFYFSKYHYYSHMSGFEQVFSVHQTFGKWSQNPSVALAL